MADRLRIIHQLTGNPVQLVSSFCQISSQISPHGFASPSQHGCFGVGALNHRKSCIGPIITNTVAQTEVKLDQLSVRVKKSVGQHHGKTNCKDKGASCTDHRSRIYEKDRDLDELQNGHRNANGGETANCEW
ncbi:hypothetical protein [uncultured Roseobacter sp.]|uniref:hypothetical protein n=1 Tax=uncultured Roseobacter sp. TaxID=114847 RepID=UPI002637A2C1|nr:hypothetical protein [uncultured Roseobacter sp.]